MCIFVNSKFQHNTNSTAVLCVLTSLRVKSQLKICASNSNVHVSVSLDPGSNTETGPGSLTLQKLGVDEQLQTQQHHHQDDTGHQETVKASAQQTHLPRGCPPPTARLQPVRPGTRETERRGWNAETKENVIECKSEKDMYSNVLVLFQTSMSGAGNRRPVGQNRLASDFLCPLKVFR